MSHLHAGWLFRKSREEEERPGELYKFLDIQRGQTVCDFGCGNGYHAIQMAKRVGPRGKVLAVDIQPEMLEKLNRRVETRGFNNVEPILATDEESGLPEGKVDLVLMVDVYHELSDPPPVMKEVKKSLKPDGRLVLVEFREEDPGVPIRPLHKMSKRQVHRELTAQGFLLVSQYDKLPWQHVMVYASGEGGLPKVELEPWAPPETEQNAPK
ncbi:MAG: class I SAM-dependent methyltransferase [Lacipirellulaceae bacterium]